MEKKLTPAATSPKNTAPDRTPDVVETKGDGQQWSSFSSSRSFRPRPNNENNTRCQDDAAAVDIEMGVSCSAPVSPCKRQQHEQQQQQHPPVISDAHSFTGGSVPEVSGKKKHSNKVVASNRRRRWSFNGREKARASPKRRNTFENEGKTAHSRTSSSLSAQDDRVSNEKKPPPILKDNDDTDDTCDESSEGDDDDDESDAITAKKKLLDIEAMLDLCVLRLRPPDDYDRNANKDSLLVSAATGAMTTMSRTLLGRTVSRAASRVRRVSRSIWPGARRHTAAAASKSMQSVTERVPLLGESKEESPRPRRCPQLAARLCRPCTAIWWRAWRHVGFRFSFFPGALVLCWTLVRVSLSTFHWFLAPLVNLELPFVALGLSGVTIVAQCWIISGPIASGLASILSQLQELVYFAFDEMLETIPRTLTKLLKTFKVPDLIAVNLCKILFLPLKEALGTVKTLIPNLDLLFPVWVREPKPLVPVIFVLLLTILFFAQILVLLMMGTMIGTGDLEVMMCVSLCAGLGQVGKNANRIVSLLLGCVEWIVNGLVQYLLRKIIMVERLQKAIDLTIINIPNPVALVKRRRDKKRKKARKKKRARRKLRTKEQSSGTVVPEKSATLSDDGQRLFLTEHETKKIYVFETKTGALLTVVESGGTGGPVFSPTTSQRLQRVESKD